MKEELDPIRYSIIHEKNPREIVMLRGSGCKWRRCRFCNYHLDFSTSEEENVALNEGVLDNVTGQYHRLEIINSGSFLDLDEKTVERIEVLCGRYAIKDLHIECHWMHREEMLEYRQRFEASGCKVHIKTGVETFDQEFRETTLAKGFGQVSPQEIAKYFDDVCLLQGVIGQSIESMQQDIEIGLLYFDRVCINIMVENGMPVMPDYSLIEAFRTQLYSHYIQNERIDILMENTEFGVGGNQKTFDNERIKNE